MTFFTCLMLVTVSSMPPVEQTRPDLSGRWLNVKVVDGKDVIQDSLVITQDAKVLTTTSYGSDGDVGEKGRFVFGETTLQATPPGVEATALANWKGSTLATTMTIKVQGELRSVVEQVWSIDAAGNLVIESTRKPVSGLPQTTKTVFKRAPAVRPQSN